MNDWSHGYDVSVGYSHGFYREMAPDWLDLCAAVSGVGTPREPRSGAFRYLELGSGQGIGLCLLAAANPDAEFVGVDFMSDHIAHSQKVAAAAGLTNVRFVEADFLDLAQAWPADFGTFDYVTLHGIYTWVTDALREAVVDCLAHSTHAGSLVYVGYNTQPGWLSSMPFQHLTQELKRATGHSGLAAIEDSIRLFDRLLSGNALTFQAQPTLKVRLEAVKEENPNYLIQEYINDGWRPMWHSEVAGQLRRAGLNYVASATIVENLLPDMLPPALKEPILEQGSVALRQDLQDFVLNQPFRRDIFRRGPAEGPGTADLSSIRLRLLSPPASGATIRVDTAFGEAKLEPPAYADVIAALASGSKSIEELLGLSRTTKENMRRVLLLMLESPAVAVESAKPASPETAHRLNAVLARGVCEGAPYAHLAAAELGSAIPATNAQMMLLDCWLESSGQPDVEALAAGLTTRASKLDVALPREAKALTQTFVEKNLPRLRQFGCIA